LPKLLLVTEAAQRFVGREIHARQLVLCSNGQFLPKKEALDPSPIHTDFTIGVCLRQQGFVQDNHVSCTAFSSHTSSTSTPSIPPQKKEFHTTETSTPSVHINRFLFYFG
jgi:hypothetical protein